MAICSAILSCANAQAADFSGKWIYEGKFDLDGKFYRVVHQLDLIQRGSRVCGCWQRVGASNDKVEYRVLSGTATGNVLDFYADEGDVSVPPEEYRATYPFAPYSAERFQKRGKDYFGPFSPEEKRKTSLKTVFLQYLARITMRKI